MSGKAIVRKLAAANRLNKFLPTVSVVLFVVSFLSCSTAISHAAIVGSGDVSPTDPATWTSNTHCDIGRSSTGTITVDGGSALLSSSSYIAYLVRFHRHGYGYGHGFDLDQ